MSNPLHPSDGIVISRKWLEALLIGYDTEATLNRKLLDMKRLGKYKAKHEVILKVLENSQPLKPVLEVAWEDGFESGLKKPESRELDKSTFLNNTIDIK
ncbi:hypothetical protein ACLOAU_14570 [Niabella sp. CJ426]|uniref:hypothetical protein n=1 Tax=Niabella sp. CJ426 TaxID=3393740 RepID=UPI003D005DDB